MQFAILAKLTKVHKLMSFAIIHKIFQKFQWRIGS